MQNSASFRAAFPVDTFPIDIFPGNGGADWFEAEPFFIVSTHRWLSTNSLLTNQLVSPQSLHPAQARGGECGFVRSWGLAS